MKIIAVILCFFGYAANAASLPDKYTYCDRDYSESFSKDADLVHNVFRTIASRYGFGSCEVSAEKGDYCDLKKKFLFRVRDLHMWRGEGNDPYKYRASRTVMYGITDVFETDEVKAQISADKIEILNINKNNKDTHSIQFLLENEKPHTIVHTTTDFTGKTVMRFACGRDESLISNCNERRGGPSCK